MNPEAKTPIRLTPETVRTIEQIINRRNKVEIGFKNGKLCVWEIQSKTKHEQPVAYGGRDSHLGLSVLKKYR